MAAASLRVLARVAALAWVAAAFRGSVVGVPGRRGVVLAAEAWSAGSIVAAQDSHGLWYAAEVLESSSARGYLVHYLGWEDSWDEWVEPWRVATLDGGGGSGEGSGEGSEARRAEALRSNDLWQFAQFSSSFVGEFEGRAEALGANGAKRGSRLSVTRADASGETPHAGWTALVSGDRSLELRPGDFRGDAERRLREDEVLGGTAANAGAFTTATRLADRLVCDVWLRRADKLLALQVAYRLADDAWRFDAAGLARLDAVGAEPRQESPDLGAGLYDPHPHLADPVVLTLPDRLTCAFPKILRDGLGVVSLDWTVDTVRTQVDRVFHRPDASLTSLEITEILADKAG